jgi:hypothetical protein
MLLGTEDFTILHNIQASSGTHPAFYMSTGVPSQDFSSQNMKLTTDVHVLEIISFMNVLAP